jgi:hypothetical protein
VTTTSNPPALPERSGDHPKSGPEIPHQQLNQIAPASLQEELWHRMTGLEGVRPGRSHVCGDSCKRATPSHAAKSDSSACQRLRSRPHCD